MVLNHNQPQDLVMHTGLRHLPMMVLDLLVASCHLVQAHKCALDLLDQSLMFAQQ